MEPAGERTVSVESTGPLLIVLKTRPEYLDQVVESQTHALNGLMSRAKRGDILLLAEILGRGSSLVRYAMRFRDQTFDEEGKSEALFGRRWTYLVHGEDCCELTPFSPQERKVTSKNYGQGGGMVYVADEDAEAFRRAGLLQPLL